MRNLREELKEPVLRLSNRPSEFQCILDLRQPCCHGRGYKISTSGQYTIAALCDCVKSCARCYGKARMIDGSTSKSCRERSPLTYVNQINRASIPSRYGWANLGKFNNFSGNGKDVVNSVRNWCRSYQPQKSKGLILGGTVGVGKTFLVAALAFEMIGRGYSVKFVDFFELTVELRAAFSNAQSDSSIIRPLIDVDILIIDELGKGQKTEWEISVLDQLVMGRYNQKKIIVASTNYGLFSGQRHKTHGNERQEQEFCLDESASLESRVESRVYSRLVEMSSFIDMTGDNFRKRLSKTLMELPSPRELPGTHH